MWECNLAVSSDVGLSIACWKLSSRLIVQLLSGLLLTLWWFRLTFVTAESSPIANISLSQNLLVSLRSASPLVARYPWEATTWSELSTTIYFNTLITTIRRPQLLLPRNQTINLWRQQTHISTTWATTTNTTWWIDLGSLQQTKGSLTKTINTHNHGNNHFNDTCLRPRENHCSPHLINNHLPKNIFDLFIHLRSSTAFLMQRINGCWVQLHHKTSLLQCQAVRKVLDPSTASLTWATAHHNHRVITTFSCRQICS